MISEWKHTALRIADAQVKLSIVEKQESDEPAYREALVEYRRRLREMRGLVDRAEAELPPEESPPPPPEKAAGYISESVHA